MFLRAVRLPENKGGALMRPYAYYVESDYYVDWSRVCRECWQFPNLCDHVGVRVLMLRVIQ